MSNRKANTFPAGDRNASLAGGRALHLTPAFTNELKDQELERLRTEKTAATLLRYARTRKPNVMPHFLAPATEPVASATSTSASSTPPPVLKATSIDIYKPTSSPIPSPALGIAAGVALTSFTDSNALALTAAETASIMAKERTANEKWFAWWEERLVVRAQNSYRDSLENTLMAPLENSARDFVSREEEAWMRQLCPGNTGSGQVSINPKLSSFIQKHGKAGGADFMSMSNGLTPVGATARGLIVPIHSMEALFRNVRAILHSRATSLLLTYHESRAAEADATGTHTADLISAEVTVSFNSDNERVKFQQAEAVYLNRLTETEKELADDAERNSTLVPSCVSLPADRVLAPVLLIETATAVALVWKILEQVRMVVPGMDFALVLFKNYLLPHIYENFMAFANILPQVGSLSEQIGLLTSIPLRAQVSMLVTDSSLQSHDDIKYMEATLKHWALRTWRKAVLARRLHIKKVESFTGLLQRLKKQMLVRAVFDSWRFEARQGANMSYMNGIDEQYRRFLNGSELQAQVNCLPDTVSRTGSASGETSSQVVNFNRTHYLAVKLAETAEHTKGVPAGALMSMPSKQSTDGQAQVPPPLACSTPMQHSDDNRAPSARSHASGVRAPTPRNPTTKYLVASPPLRSGRLSISHRSLMSQSDMRRQSFVSQCTSRDSRKQSARALPIQSSKDMYALQNRSRGTFEDMLAKLKETEEVCNHLRSEIAIQNRMVQKLESDKRGLQERNRTLEEDLVKTVEEKVHYCNLVQEKHFMLMDRDRRIAQLKSRLRAHRNRPWQKVVMRVMGELCGSSTQLAEASDELRISKDLRSESAPDAKKGGKSSPGATSDEDRKDGDEDMGDSGQAAREAEEERLFGELAPIVLNSTHHLPDALVILQDWANCCLNDLQSLDDLKGGALSVRFSSFSEEARSGVLISRLLFYLALPRYLQRTANNGEHQGEAGFFSTDYPDRRRQLLEQRNVQLDSPFPVYADCFGDLLDLRPSERMMLLLQFATELVMGTNAPASDALAMKRQEVESAIFNVLDIAQPPGTGRIELQEIIDPHALAMGERASVVTLIALLYTRFAHPFNHKCRQSAEAEKAAILYLLSGGKTMGSRPGGSSMSLPENSETSNTSKLEEAILAQLDDEDKSPWQLFKERCLPMFGTDAHPFLLRGNFWPSDAFDSPHLAVLLGELGMALNRSLQLHRWHVTMACLVPVMTYSGLSRGVFTGPRASPMALQVGLESEGSWEFPLHSYCLQRVYQRRSNAVKAFLTATNAADSLSANDVGSPMHLMTSPHKSMMSFPPAEAGAPDSSVVVQEKARLMQALHVASEDLLSLFLSHSVLSAELALPTLDLGGWRLLCADMQVVSLRLGEEDETPLTLETVTHIFFQAVRSLNESFEQPKGGRRASLGKQALQVTVDMVKAENSAGDKLSSEAVNNNSMSAPAAPPPLSIESAAGSVTNPVAGSGVMVPLSFSAVRMDMTFAAFAIAMVLLADAVYPVSQPPMKGATPLPSASVTSVVGQDPLSLSATTNAEDSQTTEPRPQKQKKPLKPIVWLGDAVSRFVNTYALRSDKCLLSSEPQVILKRMQMGTQTQEVIALYTPAIILVFNAYSKDIYGSAGMEKEDLLQMLRDAMLTSTEISQYLVFELFQHCCVTRRAVEEEAAAVRREVDGKPRVGGGNQKRRAPRAVSIMDPRTNAVSSHRRRDAQVLVMEGFIHFLCVMCHFKQPNPLIPFYQRLEVFLRRSVLRPLCPKIDNLGPLLNRSRQSRENAESADQPDRRQST